MTYTATTVYETEWIGGSVRGVYETAVHLAPLPTFGRDLLDITYTPILQNKPIGSPDCSHVIVVS